MSEGRKRPELPLSQLLAISVFWLGINSVLGALNYQALQPLAEMFLGPLYGPAGFAFMLAIAVLAAAITQPTVGMISDYTITRWGRRKPYIVIGGLLDVLFLAGVALANDFIVLTALVLLVTFSSNFARGAFQAYVPDLVPQQQTGLASGLAGLMSIVGNTIGVALVAGSVYLGEEFGVVLSHPYGLAIVAVGLVELVTAAITFLGVDEKDIRSPGRRRRSLLQIGLSAWSPDVLRERSFLWLLASRLFLLGGLSVVPAGVLSGRFGRKPVLFAAAGIGAAGAIVIALAPGIPLALAGAAMIGLAAGTYLAVEWALFADIIPKDTPARYLPRRREAE